MLAVKTIMDWRRNSKLVNAASETLKGGVLQEMLALLECDNPMTKPLPNEASPHAQSRYLGFAEGWHWCIRNLRALGESPVIKSFPEPTYTNKL